MTAGPRRLGGTVLPGVLAFAAGLAGCGAAQKAPPPPRRNVVASKAPQVVSMRRIDGATYETVVIRADGSGDVGVFIGERTGVTHQAFRVSARELSQLRRLAGVAAELPQARYFGTPAPSVVYILFDHGRVLEVAKGHVPRRVAGLTSILSGLIDRYA